MLCKATETREVWCAVKVCAVGAAVVEEHSDVGEGCGELAVCTGVESSFSGHAVG